MKHLRALTFDLDDTLWDNGPVLKAAEQTLYDWLGQHYPRIKARHSLVGIRNLSQILLQRNPEMILFLTLFLQSGNAAEARIATAIS